MARTRNLRSSRLTAGGAILRGRVVHLGRGCVRSRCVAEPFVGLFVGSFVGKRMESSLVGALDLRLQGTLGGAGSGLPTSGPPKDECRPNGQQRAEERACHVDPVIGEVRPDEVRAEGSSGFIEVPEIGLPHRPASAM